MPDQSQSNQSQSSSSLQPQPSSITPNPQVPTTSTPPSPPANPGGGQQQALPISPLTGELYDPEWGAIIQKGGGGSQRTIQQVMKPEIERKAGQ